MIQEHYYSWDPRGEYRNTYILELCHYGMLGENVYATHRVWK